MKNNSFYIQYAKETIKDFSAEETALSIKIFDKDGDLSFSSNENDLSLKIFPLLKKLKKEITEKEQFIRSLPNFGKVSSTDISYYYTIEELKMQKVIILDLRSAYLNIAKKLGIVSEKLFDKINVLPKKERLVILGMIASNPYYSTYNNGELETTERIKKDPFGYDVFTYIQYSLGKFMEEVLMKFYSDIVYFWVDEIAFFPDILPDIENYVASNFDFKIEVKDVEIFNSKGISGVIVDRCLKLNIPHEYYMEENLVQGIIDFGEKLIKHNKIKV